ncbi:MAG TPA: hypothetical protein VFI11_13765 [Anaerolineales bacterium]|nr:hypothetical protein [Anaerolineales bacterium]
MASLTSDSPSTVRPPFSLIATSVAGALLGAGLAVDGLTLRIFANPTSPLGALGMWTGGRPLWALDAASLGWPMIAIGCAWLAVVLGLWMRLSWIRRVGLVLALLTAPALGIALVLDLVALAGLLSPAMMRWVASGEAARVV